MRNFSGWAGLSGPCVAQERRAELTGELQVQHHLVRRTWRPAKNCRHPLAVPGDEPAADKLDVPTRLARQQLQGLIPEDSRKGGPVESGKVIVGQRKWDSLGMLVTNRGCPLLGSGDDPRISGPC